jgi:hypothetical protein
VPDLAGKTIDSTLCLSSDNVPAADASAKRDHPHVSSPTSGAAMPFGKRCKVAVVVDMHLSPQSVRELGPDRDIHRSWNVRGCSHDTIERD